MTKMCFDPREYFGDELAARGIGIQDCVGTVKRWYLNPDAPLTPLVAWAIGVQFQMSGDTWLGLEAQWQKRAEASR